MKRTVITTLPKSGYDQYGKRMLETFLEHWPDDVDIVIVSEDVIDLPKSNRVKFEDYGQIAPEGDHFKRKFGNFSEARGTFYKVTGDGDSKAVSIEYSAMHDAIKWSHKVFAVNGVSRKYDCDRLIWMDADIVTFRPIDAELLDYVDPGEGHMSYLGREHEYGHSECSFLVFNKRNPIHTVFMNNLISEYMNGELFLLHEWHDCFMWDILREHYSKTNGVTYKNISGEGTTTEHPFVNSFLGQYMDHLKGPDRKIAGHSFEEDYLDRAKNG
ncbi:MAG: hypothetical protein RIC16_03585 [Rhodospirillales bacterium]